MRFVLSPPNEINKLFLKSRVVAAAAKPIYFASNIGLQTLPFSCKLLIPLTIIKDNILSHQ